MNDGNPHDFEILSEEWTRAIVSNKADAIGRFMADDWVIVGETGVNPRSDFLRLVSTGALTHREMKGTVTRVRVYDNVAVVSSRGKNSGTYKGQPFSSDEWITDVFVKQQGRWRCVLTHLSPAKDTSAGE